MREIPMLFSTPMVQAFMDGRKTVTRRTNGLDVINENPGQWKLCWVGKTVLNNKKPSQWVATFQHKNNDKKVDFIKSPYGQKGDLIWVRETVFDTSKYPNAPLFSGVGKYVYKADEAFIGCHKWTPSIHMPKAAARIWLLNEGVTVERLQDITEEDAIAEGVKRFFTPLFQEWRYKDYLESLSDWRSAYNSFSTLWMSINGFESWDANPWVWVIRFKVVSTTGREAVKI